MGFGLCKYLLASYNFLFQMALTVNVPVTFSTYVHCSSQLVRHKPQNKLKERFFRLAERRMISGLQNTWRWYVDLYWMLTIKQKLNVLVLPFSSEYLLKL